MVVSVEEEVLVVFVAKGVILLLDAFYCCDCCPWYCVKLLKIFAFPADVLVVNICCFCWSNCCHGCRCCGKCCCSASTIFHPCWSSQLAAHSVALCQQIGLRWMPTALLLERKKERPPLMPALPFTMFCFSLFLMSPSVLSVFLLLWFVAAGSDRGGGNFRVDLC